MSIAGWRQEFENSGLENSEVAGVSGAKYLELATDLSQSDVMILAMDSRIKTLPS